MKNRIIKCACLISMTYFVLSFMFACNSFDKRNTLINAVRKGDFEKVKKYISEGVNVNVKNSNGITALIAASMSNQENIVKYLLSIKNIDVNGVDKTGQTALMWAIGRGNYNIANMLLKDSRIDVAKRNKSGGSSLLAAIIFEREFSDEKIRIILSSLLMTKKFNINEKDNSGFTPLIWAVWTGNENVVQLLIGYGADINEKDYRGRTALMWAAMGEMVGFPKVLQKIFSPYPYPHETWFNKKVLDLLIENGANILLKDNDKWSALTYAIYRYYDKKRLAKISPHDDYTVALLLKNGASDEKITTKILLKIQRLLPYILFLLFVLSLLISTDSIFGNDISLGGVSILPILIIGLIKVMPHILFVLMAKYFHLNFLLIYTLFILVLFIKYLVQLFLYINDDQDISIYVLPLDISLLIVSYTIFYYLLWEPNKSNTLLFIFNILLISFITMSTIIMFLRIKEEGL